MASVYNFIICQMILEVLYDLDSEVEIVASVGIDQFANVLSLIWTLFQNLAVVLEQVLKEEPLEFFLWTLAIFIYLSCKCLAEDESVYERA